MVGRVIACILLVLLAALVIALTIPARARFSYDQGALSLWVRYGPVRLQLFPPKEKPPRKKRRTKEELAAQEPPQSDSSPSERLKEKRKKKSPKPPKPRPGINLDQILYSLETLPPVLVRLLGAPEDPPADRLRRSGGHGYTVRTDPGRAVRRSAPPAKGGADQGPGYPAVSGLSGGQDGLHCRRRRLPAARGSGMGGPAGRGERAEMVSGIPEAGLAASGQGADSPKGAGSRQ